MRKKYLADKIADKNKKYLRKVSDFAMIGGVSALVVGVFAGCDINNPNEQNPQAGQAIKQGAFVLLEQQADGSYKVLEEYPSGKTHIVVRDTSGNERVLSDEEIQKLLKEEEQKIDNGTSALTASHSGGESGGLGLGGAILASAAGAMLGSYIGNKLFNNPNYQQNKQRTYKSPQAYERSANSFGKSNSAGGVRGATPSNAKGGFFGGSQSGTKGGTPSKSSGFGG